MQSSPTTLLVAQIFALVDPRLRPALSTYGASALIVKEIKKKRERTQRGKRGKKRITLVRENSNTRYAFAMGRCFRPVRPHPASARVFRRERVSLRSRAIYRAYSSRTYRKSFIFFLSLSLSRIGARGESLTIRFDTRNKRSPRLFCDAVRVSSRERDDTRRCSRSSSRSGHHVGFNIAQIIEWQREKEKSRYIDR